DETNGHHEQGPEEDFASLLEEYSDGNETELRVGDRIRGKIISIGRDAVFVDTGLKTDGVVDLEELAGEDGEVGLSPGDVLDLYVVAVTPEEIRLSKALSGAGDISLLREAFRSGVPIEGRVVSPCKGGFQVQVMKRRAFCPISQMDVRYVNKPEEYVGLTTPFLITRFEENGRNIVLSRRRLLEDQYAKEREDFMSGLAPETEVEGTVTRLMPFGAFVELVPGLEGLVHISEMSWSRVDKPEQVVQTGDKVRVRVLGVEAGDRADRPRISLSLKQMETDPWERVHEICSEGDLLQGRVTRCADFGAFVELGPGLEGLVHVSEMSHTRRVARPEEVAAPGDLVSVVVKEIDSERRRISLSIKDATGDPWADVEDSIKPGQTVDGTIEKEERYGYFINLAPGITGLLHKSRLEEATGPEGLENLKPGQRISVLVESVDPEAKRIALAPKAASDQGNWKEALGEEEQQMGALGEKLRKAMDEQDQED
ncbi:MAG: 30S ribosomal protein S1, partial [Desulfobacteraceae bacterium]